MKCKNLFVLLVAAVCLAACNAPRERVIERPLAGVRNTTALEIDKIVLTDTATVIYVDAFYNPGQWIRIDTTAYLSGGGEKYVITGAEGIELRAEHWMPESGESSFVLFFEPINPKLKAVDFIEGEPDGYFKIWDIQLRGSKVSGKYRSAVPSSVRNVDYKKASLPEPTFNSAETVVKVHILGEPSGYHMPPSLTVAGVLELYSDEMEPDSAENGTYIFTVPVYGTSQGMLSVAGKHITVMLDPGMENNIWIDLVQMSRKNSRYNSELAGDEPDVLTDGRYAAVNAVLGNGMIGGEWSMQLFSSLDDVVPMLDKTPAQLASDIRSKYDGMINMAEQDGSLSQIEKQLIEARLGGEYVFSVSQLASVLIWAQKQKLGIEPQNPLPAGTEPFSFADSDYSIFLGGLDAASLSSMYAENPGYGYVVLGMDERRELLGVENNAFLTDIVPVGQMMSFVGNMQDAPEDVQAKFDAVTNQELKSAVELKKAVMQKKIEAAKLKTGYRICDVPQVADTGLFDAIMERYAGKVVVVDFWATWCGPCRAAMKSHEPHKDAYIGKDVVFVYLTGETSPRSAWEVAIADVRGDHYYLTDSQWKYVCDQFEVRGIPSWVVVTKDGEYLKEELYSPDEWESVINRELAK